VSRRWAKAALALSAASLPTLLLALASGPDPRHTAAPGDVPMACATGGCHTSALAGPGGPINFHGGSVSATFSQGGTYTPGGDPVSITVSVADPVNSTYGFQMTARLESNQATSQAGRFTSSQGSFVLCDSGSPRSPQGNCPASFPVEFIEHSIPRSGTWTFTWTPPATNAGPVHFYVAGNAVNNNGSNDADDHVYTNHYVLTPAGACSESAPSLTGVISAGAFGARTNFASGSWLELYGSNLSTVTKEWTAQDFQGSDAPQSLDRVRVTVNGKPAFPRFISSGQVNVQAPADDAVGPVAITLTNCAQSSGATMLNKDTAAPGMLAPPSFVVGGKQLLVALFLDGVTFVGNIPGVPSRPAKPGEMIVTYGIGFGATEPFYAPGTIAAGLNSLVEPLAVTVGGVQLPPANITYKGLAPGFIGLYQFNLVIPDVPDGDAPVTISVGGRTVPQTLFLPVKR
jgi:uncharacterized protein (TIGR03437 family)